MRLPRRVFRVAGPLVIAVVGPDDRRGADRGVVGVAGAADPRRRRADQERRAGQGVPGQRGRPLLHRGVPGRGPGLRCWRSSPRCWCGSGGRIAARRWWPRWRSVRLRQRVPRRASARCWCTGATARSTSPVRRCRRSTACTTSSRRPRCSSGTRRCRSRRRSCFRPPLPRWSTR